MMTKDEYIRVYLTEETKEQIQKQAQKEGLEPSPWMRQLAKKQLPHKVEA